MTLTIREPWHTRLSTILLASSMVALGVALGLELFATKLNADLIIHLGPQYQSASASVEAFYQRAIWTAIAYFAAASVGVVGMETVVQTPENGGETT